MQEIGGLFDDIAVRKHENKRCFIAVSVTVQRVYVYVVLFTVVLVCTPYSYCIDKEYQNLSYVKSGLLVTRSPT